MVQSLLVCNITMGNLCSSAPKLDPDSAWKEQNKASKENPMYRFAKLEGGGILATEFEKVFQNDGREAADEAIKKIAREQIEPLLYNQGKGKLASKADLLRWKHESELKRNGSSNGIHVSDETLVTEYKNDKFNKVEERRVCWKLEHRGAVGETPVHLLFLKDSYIHTEVGYLLLDLYPNVALDIYEADEYYGESCLHIAIVYGNFELVKRLIQCGADVNQRATGQFFLPEDQKIGKKRKQTNYDGYAYYGEYPLAFACCFANREIYDYLLDHGADPDAQDSFGNTVLHMAVIANQVEMYKYAFQHHKKPAKPALKNKAKLTPLTLASKLGRHKLFLEMLELSSVVSWHYSNIKCSVYPLAPLDTISPTGDTNWQSALWFIINGETDEHLDMLEGGVVRQLLEWKWKTFAARRFLQRLVLALFHLIMVSISVYLRPADNLLQYRGARDAVRYTAEIITVIGCVTNTVISLKEIYTQGFMGFVRNCKHAPAKTIFLLSCVLMALCVPCRLLSLVVDPNAVQQVEDTLLIVAVPCAWVFLLFFARSVKLTGPFVTMIYKMCTGDLFRFGIIYTIFLCGFTQGFYFLFRHIEDKTITSFDSLPTTVMTLIQMTLGEFRYQEFDYTHYAFLTKLVFGVFMVIVPILLLNMLIAMMGNTYQQVISKSEKEWRRQSAKIVVVLERAFQKADLKKFQEKYSVEMGSPSNEDDEKKDGDEEKHCRGLMVIKACNKTKARQRKGAVNNWKKFGREVMRQIKEQKKAGKKGPLELKTRKRHSKNRRSRSREKMDDDRPSSGESIRASKNIFSAVDQLAWETKLDYQQGQSLEKHVSQMTIPVYDSDDLEETGAVGNEKKPPLDRRHRKVRKAPTDSPKHRRAHRNQVEPIPQEGSPSPSRSIHEPALMSIPSETTLDIVTLGEGGTFFTTSTTMTDSVNANNAGPLAEATVISQSSPKRRGDDGYTSSLGSAGSRGPVPSEGSAYSQESPHRRKRGKRKKDKKEQEDKSKGSNVHASQYTTSLTSLINPEGNAEVLHSTVHDTEV